MKTNKVFNQRLDFYWQSIAVYAIVVCAYIATKVIVKNIAIADAFHDPIVILLSFFIVYSLVSFVSKFYRLKTIIIGENNITFRNRFRETSYDLDNIERIFIGKERKFNSKQRYRIIKIKLKNRITAIRIRPSTYWDDAELLESITHLKQKISK
jgi:hypothetical protein